MVQTLIEEIPFKLREQQELSGFFAQQCFERMSSGVLPEQAMSLVSVELGIAQWSACWTINDLKSEDWSGYATSPTDPNYSFAVTKVEWDAWLSAHFTGLRDRTTIYRLNTSVKCAILEGEITEFAQMVMFVIRWGKSQITYWVLGYLDKNIDTTKVVNLAGEIINLSSLGFNMVSRERKLHQSLLQQKEEITSQLEIIEAQSVELIVRHQDIVDSMNYASRIQSTILQQPESLRVQLPKSFVFFRPKEQLSGDFYWWTVVGDVLLLGVADCTGHGVPGAMISFMGINLLNQMVLETHTTDPAHILTLLNFRMICSLQPDNSEFQLTDGMDIGLCALNLRTKVLQFAGAQSSLFHERDRYAECINGDRFSIAGQELPNETDGHLLRNYTLHELNLKQGDRIYLSSDGFLDQHGLNEDGKVKKYGRKQLLNQFEGYRKHPFEAVELALRKDLDTWQQTISQTDDILIIGFEI
jgi:hypothetical protein